MTATDIVQRVLPREQGASTTGTADARLALNCFLALLLLRTFTDANWFGSSISYVLNLGVALAAIAIASILTLMGRAGRGSGVVPLLAIATAAFGLLAVVLFGVQASLIGEYIRFASILGMAVLMRIAMQGGVSPEVAVRRALTVSTPAVALIVIGFLFQVSVLVDADSGRVSGTLHQRNGAAAFVAVYFIAALWLALSSRRWLAWAQVLLGVLSLGYTLSLGGMAAAAAGAAILLISYLPRLSGVTRIVLLVLFLAAIGYGLSTPAIADRLDQLNGNVTFSDTVTASDSTNSLQWRIINWRTLLTIWQQRPVFGWGFGTTASLIQPLQRQPHNEYVRILVETGLVGAVVFLAIAVVTVVRLLRSPERQQGSTLYTLGIAVVTVALVDATVSNTISYPPMMFLFAGLLGIAASRTVRSRPATPFTARPLREVVRQGGHDA